MQLAAALCSPFESPVADPDSAVLDESRPRRTSDDEDELETASLISRTDCQRQETTRTSPKSEDFAKEFAKEIDENLLERDRMEVPGSSTLRKSLLTS